MITKYIMKFILSSISDYYSDDQTVVGIAKGAAAKSLLLAIQIYFISTMTKALNLLNSLPRVLPGTNQY